MPGTPLTYNGFDMNSATVITTEFEDGGSPERDLKIYNLLALGGSATAGDDWYSKTVPCSGSIQGSSVANVESNRDAFMAAMSVLNKNLDVGYAGGTRRYVATPRRIEVVRGRRSMNWMDFKLEFVTTGFGFDTSATTLLSASANTSATRTVPVTIGGSAPEQLLRVQITVTAATDLSDKAIGVENDTTGERIYVQRTWTVGDVIEFDCLNRTIKINGTLADFEGSFPVFAPGTHDLLIDNTFTTRTLTATIDYVRRWL